MSRIVPGVGPPHAKIAFVGESPGETEENLGLPFVGASGKLLNDFLAKSGIARSECYLTNVVKVRPPNNQFSHFYDDYKNRIESPLLTQSIANLHKELRSVAPNVICALGAEPLRALTGKRSIGSWRGSILSSPVGKVVPTYHPSFILRSDFSDAPTFQLDLRRVSRESTSAALDLPVFQFEIDPSFSRTREFLRSRPRRLAVDIETISDLVRCIGLADSSRHAMCIPFMLLSGCGTRGTSNDVEIFPDLLASTGSGPSRWSVDEELTLIGDLYALLADPTVEKVLQNFPFDSTLLAREMGLHISNLHMDTLLAQHTCHPELPKGLDYQASIYTRIPYWSDYDATSDAETWKYNCYDVCSTFEISEVHDKQLVSLGVDEFYRHHVQPSMLALTRAQNRGIRIDAELRSALAVEARTKQSESLAKVKATTGLDLNPNSPKQMQEFLYGKLKLPVQVKKDKDKQLKPTCDEDALNKLIKRFPQHREVLEFCLNYREQTKLLGTFLEGDLLNGKIYTSYNVAGTLTGRISSSTPIINPEAGGNLQQIPRGSLRRIFIPDDGWVLIKSDLSQADFRVVIWLARVQRLVEKLNDPKFDIHRWNAAHNIFNIPEEAVTKEQRTAAKASVHGSNYGMGPDKVVKLYPQFSYRQAEELQERYHRGIPEIKSVYWSETQAELQLNRTLITPFGRRRMFMGRWNDDLFRQAYAHRPQAVVGDIINRAFYLGDAILDERQCYPLLQVHDEIVWHCRKEAVATVVPIIRRLMEYEVKFEMDLPLVIPADISVGSNWYDQEPVDVWLAKQGGG